MKQLIGNYSFNTTTKTVTLTDFSTIRLDRLQLIVDTTTNKILYNFADSSVATATVATNVVTLSALQGGEANTDKLQIVYDALTGDPTYDTPVLPSNAAKETGGNLATIATNTTGVATAANQSTANTSLAAISSVEGATADAAVTTNTTGTISGKLRGLVAILADIWDSVNHRIKVDGSGVTQPVSAASLPLPSGAATSANQTTGNTSLSSIDGKLVTAKTDDYDTGAGTDTVQSVGIALPASGGHVVGGTATNPLRTDPTGTTTQPVSGTVTANAGTNLNTSALALESGGNLASVATNTTNIPGVIGTAAAAIPSKLLQVRGSDGTNARAIKTNASGQLDIRPLTSSDQVTTVPSGTQTVSGTVTANIGTSGSLALDATLTGGNQQVQGNVADAGTDSGNPVKIGGVNKTTPTTLTNGQRGDMNLDTRENLKVSLWAPNSNTAYTFGNGTSGTGVQRVTIASDSTGQITANAGTNLNTSALALETGGNLAAINTATGATTDAAVVGDNSGSLSAKLRGLTKILNDIWDSVNHRIKVDGSGVTQPISAASLPLPTGAATSANQTNASQKTQVVDGSGNVISSTANALDVNIKSVSSPSVTLIRVAIAASSSGDNTIIAAVAAKKIYVVAFELSFSGTVNAKFTDGAAGTNLGGLYYGIANAGAANSMSPDMSYSTPSPYLWAGSTNTALILNLSGAVAVGGAVTYFTV